MVTDRPKITILKFIRKDIGCQDTVTFLDKLQEEIILNRLYFINFF